jgi:hypothetical protein
LHQASDNSQYTLVQLLLEYEADPNAQQNDGDTPLHHAAFRGDIKMLRILLQNSAEVNKVNYMFGRTPLHYAADCGHIDAVRLMLEYGGDTGLTDRQGKTPLDLAMTDELKDLMLSALEISDVNLTLTEDTNEIDQASAKELPSAARSECLSPITEMNSILVTSPNESCLFPPSNCGADFDDIAPDTFGKSRKSFEIVNSGCDAELFGCGASVSSFILVEPEGEKSVVPTRPTMESDPLYDWLSKLNVQYLYNLLVDAGYDDIESMVDQMRSPLPITQETLTSIGVHKPGHAIRIVIRLEEEAGLVQPRTKRRNPSQTAQ